MGELAYGSLPQGPLSHSHTESSSGSAGRTPHLTKKMEELGVLLFNELINVRGGPPWGFFHMME